MKKKIDVHTVLLQVSITPVILLQGHSSSWVLVLTTGPLVGILTDGPAPNTVLSRGASEVLRLGEMV